jgi:hypothetical protein
MYLFWIYFTEYQLSLSQEIGPIIVSFKGLILSSLKGFSSNSVQIVERDFFRKLTDKGGLEGLFRMKQKQE